MTSSHPASPRDGAILAVDLGSTWLKAAWAAPDGRHGGATRADSPLRSSQRRPEAIWKSVLAAIHEMLGSRDAPTRPLAVALTGATRSHVFLDDAGKVMGPVVFWDDPYGESCAATVAEAFGKPQDAPGYGAFHPLARLVQFRLDSPRPPAAIVELKDWFNFRLTGRLATDAIAYSRIQPNGAGLCETAPVLERLGFAPTAVPAPLLPDTRLGAVDASEIPSLRKLDGVPVITSSFDTWCATLGMGAVDEGGIYDISGTTEVMGAFGPRPRDVPGMVCMPWAPSLWHLGGPCQTGLGTLAWFARTFLGQDTPSATLDAARRSRSTEPPLFLPYLSGERMPWWNNHLSAGFENVRAHHTRDDFALAAVEGLALAHRLAMDEIGVLRAGSVIHMGGGGTRHPYWCQTRADAFGSPVALCAGDEPALTGAALAAGVALGYHHDLRAAQRRINQDHALIRPDPQRAKYFDARAAMFSDILDKRLTP